MARAPSGPHRRESKALNALSLAWTLVILAGMRSDGLGQGPGPEAASHARPSCGDCRWKRGEPTSVLRLARAPDLWFGRIAGAAIDVAGRLYVGDVFQHQVIRIDLADGSVLRLGRPGRGPGEFEAPHLIAPVSDGRVFVLDPVLARVSEFGVDGAFGRSFRLPLRLAPPRAMVAGDGDHLFISAVARDSGAGVIHKLNVEGRLIRSFGEPGSAFRNWAERFESDGGMLWWDSIGKTLWFSRTGPRFELSAYDAEGLLRNRILLPGADTPGWRSPVEAVRSGGRVSIQSRSIMGTIALLPLPGGLLANLSAIGADSTRIDVFDTKDGLYVASWVEVRDNRVGAADGRGRVLAFRLTSEPDVLVHQIQFERNQRPQRREQ